MGVLLLVHDVGVDALEELEQQQYGQAGQQDLQGLGVQGCGLRLAFFSRAGDVFRQLLEAGRVLAGLFGGGGALEELGGALALLQGPLDELRSRVAPKTAADLNPCDHLEDEKAPEHAPDGAGAGPERAEHGGGEVEGVGQRAGRRVDAVKGLHIVIAVFADEIADGGVERFAVDLDIRRGDKANVCCFGGHSLPP